VDKIVDKICIFAAIPHTVATMKKADNSKNQSKVEANEHSDVPVAQALESKSAAVELATPLTADEKQRLAKLEKMIDAKLGDFFEVGSASWKSRLMGYSARHTAISTCTARNVGDSVAATQTS